MQDNYLEHHGIKGQKWGVRRTAKQLGHDVDKAAKKIRKLEKKIAKADRKSLKYQKKAKRRTKKSYRYSKKNYKLNKIMTKSINSLDSSGRIGQDIAIAKLKRVARKSARVSRKLRKLTKKSKRFSRRALKFSKRSIRYGKKIANSKEFMKNSIKQISSEDVSLGEKYAQRYLDSKLEVEVKRR